MTTEKHKGVDKVVSLERIVNWPFSFKLSLKIFVILLVLAHFLYIDSINNHISNHYKRKWFTIKGYLRGSTLHMSSKYFSILHSSLQDSWFWLHHSQGHQSHHPLSKSTLYQICLLKKIPSKMEVAPRYITAFTAYTACTVFTAYTAFTLLTLLYLHSSRAKGLLCL